MIEPEPIEHASPAVLEMVPTLRTPQYQVEATEAGLAIEGRIPKEDLPRLWQGFARVRTATKHMLADLYGHAKANYGSGFAENLVRQMDLPLREMETLDAMSGLPLWTRRPELSAERHRVVSDMVAHRAPEKRAAWLRVCGERGWGAKDLARVILAAETEALSPEDAAQAVADGVITLGGRENAGRRDLHIETIVSTFVRDFRRWAKQPPPVGLGVTVPDDPDAATMDLWGEALDYAKSEALAIRLAALRPVVALFDCVDGWTELPAVADPGEVVDAEIVEENPQQEGGDQ